MYRDLIGTPYKPHGRGDGGYDCLGLSIEILRRNGIILHDIGDVENGLNLEPVDVMNPLSVILIERRGREHMAVFIGDGMIIHTTETTGCVSEPIWRYKCLIKGVYKVSTDNRI